MFQHSKICFHRLSSIQQSLVTAALILAGLWMLDTFGASSFLLALPGLLLLGIVLGGIGLAVAAIFLMALRG